ncbi:MAG TPA: fibronectin type III domain-containing protein [Steroidobacteraceae bacterium]|nr:fibronectin type III domain-containing protein [Steroidobacteraceae bacterium]
MAYALLWFRHAPPHRLVAWPAAAPGYVEVMVGTLPTRVGRATGARRTGIACLVLLGSILLAGCGQSTTTSAAAAQPTATAPPAAATQPVSVTETPPPSSPSGPASQELRSVEVSWSAPTANTDGSALTDLAGYRVYYGTSPGTLGTSVDVPSAGAVQYLVRGLQTGTWYFAVAAYTNTGLESTHSSVVSKTIT